MTRPQRRDYPGAMHHVYVRGVARSAIAVDSADYEKMLFLIEHVASQYEIGVMRGVFFRITAT